MLFSLYYTSTETIVVLKSRTNRSTNAFFSTIDLGKRKGYFFRGRQEERWSVRDISCLFQDYARLPLASARMGRTNKGEASSWTIPVVFSMVCLFSFFFLILFSSVFFCFSFFFSPARCVSSFLLQYAF